MRIAVPKVITPTNLVSFNIPEDDYTTYNPLTVYAAGDVCQYNHKVYIALKGDSIADAVEFSLTDAYLKNQLVYYGKKIYKALQGVASSSVGEWQDDVFYMPGAIVKHANLKTLYKCVRGENPNNYQEHVSGVEYAANTYVLVTSEKKVYKSLKVVPSTVTTPPSENTTGLEPYWKEVGIINKGTPPDLSVLYTTEWKAKDESGNPIVYQVGDVVKVTSASAIFECLIENSDFTPLNNTAGDSPKWKQIHTFTENQVTTDDFTHIWTEYGRINIGFDPSDTENSAYWKEDGVVNRGYTPSDNTYGDDPFWSDAGATPAWAMFDDKIATATKGVACTDGRSGTHIKFSIKTSTSINCAAFFNTMASKVSMTLKNNSGTVLWSTVMKLRSNMSTSLSEYFFGEKTPIVKNNFVNFPPIPGATLDVEIYSPSQCSCGLFAIGKSKFIGLTLQGVKVSIKDYSKKTVSDAGVASLSVGAYTKAMTMDVDIENETVDNILEWIANYRATPLLFIGDNSVDSNVQYQALLIYGFYPDFSVTIPGPTVSTCSFEVQGLV